MKTSRLQLRFLIPLVLILSAEALLTPEGEQRERIAQRAQKHWVE